MRCISVELNSLSPPPSSSVPLRVYLSPPFAFANAIDSNRIVVFPSLNYEKTKIIASITLFVTLVSHWEVSLRYLVTVSAHFYGMSLGKPLGYTGHSNRGSAPKAISQPATALWAPPPIWILKHVVLVYRFFTSMFVERMKVLEYSQKFEVELSTFPDSSNTESSRGLVFSLECNCLSVCLCEKVCQ